MKSPCDHDLRIWVDAQTYLALHHQAEQDDRSLSEYVRHLIVQHLRQVSARVAHENSVKLGAVRDD